MDGSVAQPHTVRIHLTPPISAQLADELRIDRAGCPPEAQSSTRPPRAASRARLSRNHAWSSRRCNPSRPNGRSL